MNYYLNLMQSIYSVEFIREEKDGRRRSFLKNFSSRKQAEEYATKVSCYLNIIKITMLLDGSYWYRVK